jgi:hypothetical protein
LLSERLSFHKVISIPPVANFVDDANRRCVALNKRFCAAPSALNSVFDLIPASDGRAYFIAVPSGLRASGLTLPKTGQNGLIHL